MIIIMITIELIKFEEAIGQDQIKCRSVVFASPFEDRLDDVYKYQLQIPP